MHAAWRGAPRSEQFGAGAGAPVYPAGGATTTPS
jgi:hypothetical protein